MPHAALSARPLSVSGRHFYLIIIIFFFLSCCDGFMYVLVGNMPRETSEIRPEARNALGMCK